MYVLLCYTLHTFKAKERAKDKTWDETDFGKQYVQLSV